MIKLNFKTFILSCVLVFITNPVINAMPFKRDLNEKGKSAYSTGARPTAVKRAFGIDRAAASAVTSGTNNCLVILVKFSDGTTTFSPVQINSLLFTNGTYPTGSMSDYYREVSYGALTVTGTAKGWFTLPQSRAYYAGNAGGMGEGHYPENSQGMVEDALNAANSALDFSQYTIDSLIIVYSGYYDATGEDKTMVFPHKWALSEGGPGPLTYDGKTFDEYAVISEINGMENPDLPPPTTICGVGIYCHEFGHLLGLPDLYDTDYSSEGLGLFCLMAAGEYGADNYSPERPTQLSPWCKVKLGWVSPVTITENAIPQQINNIETSQEIYKVIADYSLKGNNEYFLVVNSQKKGYNADMPGSGLLVYHVDETVSGFEAGKPNDNELHKYVDLEEADDKGDLDESRSRGDAGDYFSTGVDFSNLFSIEAGVANSNAYPAGNNTQGRRIAFTITNISASSSTMKADLIIKAADTDVPTAHRSNIFTPNYDGYHDSIIFSEASGDYDISIYDIAGRKVRRLININQWDGKDEKNNIVESGVYIYQINNNGTMANGTVVVAK